MRRQFLNRIERLGNLQTEDERRLIRYLLDCLHNDLRPVVARPDSKLSQWIFGLIEAGNPKTYREN